MKKRYTKINNLSISNELLEFVNNELLKDTKILPIAVSDSIGKADFFTEQFGGFTNSIVRDFTENSKDFLSQTQRNKKTSCASS